MRVGIGLLAVAFVLLVGGQSYASTFPDLPGMGAVAKATHSQTPTASHSASGSSSSASSQAPAPKVSSAAKSTAKSQDVAPILKLPGSGSLPLIKYYNTGLRTKTAAADLLMVLAAIGTATSLGMLWAVRRIDRA